MLRKNCWKVKLKRSFVCLCVIGLCMTIALWLKINVICRGDRDTIGYLARLRLLNFNVLIIFSETAEMKWKKIRNVKTERLDSRIWYRADQKFNMAPRPNNVFCFVQILKILLDCDFAGIIATQLYKWTIWWWKPYFEKIKYRLPQTIA